RSRLGDDDIESTALDKLHRDVQGPVVGLSEIVDLDRVRVLELRHRAALPMEARKDTWVVGEVSVQGLDRHLAHRRAHLLLRSVHNAHAALSEHTGHAEATADQLADPTLIGPVGWELHAAAC